MSQIPTQSASGDIHTGSAGALGPDQGITSFGERAGSILGGGIDQLASGEHKYALGQGRYELYLKHMADRQKDQDESMEVAKKTSQMRTDFYNRISDLRDAPSSGKENILPQFNKEYDDYTDSLLSGASSPQVADHLKLAADNAKIEFMGQVHSIQSVARQSNFGANYTQMMSNAEDSIFASKSIDELRTQKNLLNSTVDSAVQTGRIKDPEVVESLKGMSSHLAVSWAEANLSDNPKLVMSAVNGEKGFEKDFEGVNIRNKEVLLNKAQSVIDANTDYDKLALRESLQSDIVQRMKTGQGSSLNLKQYENVYGKTARDAAERQLTNASSLYNVSQSVMGANTDTLSKILKGSQPKVDPTSPLYAEQQKYADQVEKIVTQADADKKDDAFTYFSQHPALKSLAMETQKNPTPGNVSNLQHAVLEMQKMDKSLAPYDYKIMPKQEAEQFIQQFNGLTEVGNKEDGGGVRDLLSQFASKYGDNTHIALNQLNSVKGGENVTSLLNPLMWHLGNPTIFRLTLDALRKDPKEAMDGFQTEKERKNFLTDASLDPNLLSYQSSIMGSSSSSESKSLVSGVKEAYTAFSRDYVLRGGKMSDASKLFFSPYSFGSANGVSYSRPRNYSDETGKSHVMSDEQIRLSNSFLSWYPNTIDPSTIAPESIVNQTKFFSSDQLTQDVQSALRSKNVFWSTTSDETGVYLFSKGEITGAPKQVKDKQGNPIRMNFVDTMKSIPERYFNDTRDFGPGGGTGQGGPMTGDTWYQSIWRLLRSTTP